MTDQLRRSFLVRLLRGCRRPQVFRLIGVMQPRQWRFNGGVAVVGESLSDALESARALLGVRDDD